ncbi:biopolymer transporter ExbD [Novosphingobium sp. SL115]|uniref:ExbD/TolR family protein n=1 Tax=Novosphingobium sp. SL115 TaxID=2995150 RepID=UPI002276D3F2|nr:biopolymer transporter ExbD [Novosphingobium sp. SL115]MCY1671207.1 biopolymer transporter ExbD [Novosphingobium sp. SL115]
MAMSMGSGGGGGRGRRGRGGRAAMSEINVTPLVDVMLVLLIIFMVTAPMLAAGVPVDLPDSKADPLDQQQDQITVSIDAQGAVFLDDQQLAPGELGDRLAGLERGPKPPLVTLRADRVLDWGRVAAVMGELNAAGFKSISLVTNSSSQAQ